jgi:hypothetical protein
MQAPPRLIYGHAEYGVGFIFTVMVLREDFIVRYFEDLRSGYGRDPGDRAGPPPFRTFGEVEHAMS